MYYTWHWREREREMCIGRDRETGAASQVASSSSPEQPNVNWKSSKISGAERGPIGGQVYYIILSGKEIHGYEMGEFDIRETEWWRTSFHPLLGWLKKGLKDSALKEVRKLQLNRNSIPPGWLGFLSTYLLTFNQEGGRLTPANFL